MVTKLQTLFVFICVFFISSCASVEKSFSLIDSDIRCCNKFDEIKFITPVLNSPFTVDFNSNSQAYNFTNGRSLISAFSIQDGISKINFITPLTSVWIPSATVIVPRFLFFDANKNKIKQEKSAIFQYYHPFEPSTMTANYAGTVTIPNGARYFIIYIDRSTIGKSIFYVQYEGLAKLYAQPIEVQESNIGIESGILMSGVGSVELELR